MTEFFQSVSMPLVGFAAFVVSAIFAAFRLSAPGKSHCWYGCLAAPVVFLLALRKAVALAFPGAIVLILAGVAGECLALVTLRGWPQPSGTRWRTAVYGTLAAAIFFLIAMPAHSQDFNRLEINAPAPSFTLKDQNGRDTRLTDFQGKVVVATFFYSTCIDVCPILLGTLEAVEERLTKEERANVHFVAVTVDPSRDTSERLKTFLAERGLNASNWTLLTGSILDLTRMANAFEIVVRPGAGGDFVHNSVFIVIDPDGIDRVELHGAATPATAIADEVRQVLQAGSLPAKTRVLMWLDALLSRLSGRLP